MSIEITVPRLGWSMDEGTFSEWLKKDGDWINKGDLLFVLESEKAAQEIESFDEGVLQFLPGGPQPGDIVKVGQTIGRLVPRDGATASVTKTTSQPEAKLEQPVSTPRARRTAAELGIDWTQVAGTGRDGRVRERDIRSATPTVTASTTTVPAGTKTPLTATRRAIADRLLASAQTTAPVTLMRRVDATNLLALRRQFVKVNPDTAPSLTALIIKLTAEALRQHPELNAHWLEDRLETFAAIHVGCAMETPQGLLVPVIRDVERLSVSEVSQSLVSLKAKGDARQLTPADLKGSTFTVTNLGRWGIETFTPILNPPEIGILGVGAIQRLPVVLEDDRIVPRDLVSLSLTFDHRAIDGAPAAECLQTITSAIENPAAWLIGRH